MFNLLKSGLSIPYEGCPSGELEAGKKVKFSREIEDELKAYYIAERRNRKANRTWLYLGELIHNEDNLFSILHVAGKGSCYPNGTVVIEIGFNQDIEVRADILELTMETKEKEPVC